MKIAGKDFSIRELVLLGFTLLVALGFGLSWLSRQLGDQEGGARQVMEELARSSSRLQLTSRNIEEVKKKLKLGKFQLPSTEDSPKVLSHIDKVARESGLGFSTLSATAPKKGRKYQTILYKFTSTSELKSLVKFVDTIQQGVYLIGMESWDMKPAEDPKNVQANLTLRAYFRPSEGKR